jgi:hypothetical protein
MDMDNVILINRVLLGTLEQIMMNQEHVFPLILLHQHRHQEGTVILHILISVYHPLLQIWIVVMMVFQIMLRFCNPDPHRLDGDKDGVGCEGSSAGGGGNDNSNGGGGSTSTNECRGQADCFRGTVTEIVDGDTLDINNVRVRLALVNTPERGENGYTEGIDFVQSVCSVGTTALVDEDDGQKEGSFDRVIGLVYCGSDNINNKKSLNELLLEGGYAVIYQDFCGISEFSSASWAQSPEC